MFKESFTILLQFFEIGKKSLNKSSKIKTPAATGAPSGTPGTVVRESGLEEIVFEEIKASVFKTP